MVAREASVPRWGVWAALAVGLASVAIALAAALTRGPWIDEFWTLFATDPSLTLGDEIRTRWLTDVHPPLSFLLSRGAAEMLGGNIDVLRLQNLPALLLLVGFFLYADRQWRGSRRFVMIYGVLVFSSYFSTGYFAEFRSYYWQFVASVCLFGCGYALLREDLVGGAREWVTAGGVLLCSALALVNLHFIAALLTAITLGGMAAIAMLQRRTRLALEFCGIGIVAGLPLAATLWVQAPYLMGASGKAFWITTGPLEATGILAGSVAKGIGLSVAACALATWAVWSGQVRRRADLLIGIGFISIAVTGAALLLAINSFRPVVVDRYLLVCSAAICCGLAILCQDIAFSLRYAFMAILINAALFLGIAGNKLVGEARWNASAAAIGAQVAACPSTDVTAFAYPFPGTLKNEDAVFTMGYRYLARRYGFTVHVAEPGQAAPKPGSGCPTLIWTEHVPWRWAGADGPDALVLKTAQAVLGPIDVAGARVERTKTGAIITLAPGTP